MKKIEYMFNKLVLKQFSVVLLFFMISARSVSQVDANLLVNINTAANVAEMNAIANPETGSLIFNIEVNTIFFFDGSEWVSNTLTHIPHIANADPIEVNQSLIEKIILTGSNFTTATTLTIPSFSGTFTYNVISDTQIELTTINPTIIGFYDIVLTKNGLSNTSWPNNGVDKLEVIKSDGSTPKYAGSTCKAIYDDGYASGDKNYWINPDGNDESNAFEAYCDMTNGGWTEVAYVNDLPLEHQFGSSNDSRKWLNHNFYLKFTDTQINDIRNASTEAKQNYISQCRGVITYLYQTSNYNYSFGFRFHTDFESNYGSNTYNVNVIVSNDNCKNNNANVTATTTFTINDIRLPITNVNSRDNGAYSEKFGSLLTQNSAWFK